jgi:hypothetical protein
MDTSRRRKANGFGKGAWQRLGRAKRMNRYRYDRMAHSKKGIQVARIMHGAMTILVSLRYVRLQY